MKSIKLSEFEIYLLQESLKYYKELLSRQEFSKNSIMTREYVEMMIQQIEIKFTENPVKQKIKGLYATT